MSQESRIALPLQQKTETKGIMNSKMTLHNIKVAWRNLTKYKVQNIIAVLCLAVGLVCFSMSFIITQRVWQDWKRAGGDPHRARVSFVTQGDSVKLFCPDDIQRVADHHLPSIDFIDIKYGTLGLSTEVIDTKGKTHQVTAWIEWISPEHLNYLELRSAITGKRIPVLKPGDIIMTRGMLERTFGKDVNPVGFEVKRLTYHGNSTVTDVVDTGDWVLNEDKLMIVTNMLEEWANKQEPTSMSSFDVILAKGKKVEDLQKELQEVLPEYKLNVETDFTHMDKSGLFFTLIIGGSILLIGVFGFLKTQIQLFRLRQREMGLRRCVGAQKGQLFSMMMWEVVIVFFFVTILTLLLTASLADYAVPIMQKEIMHLSVDMPRTYASELWICLLTFLLTSGIAALSVRGVVTTPLSEVVGKSRRTSTRGRSLLITLQMVVCQMLLFFILGTIVFGQTDTSEPANADVLRSCLVTDKYEWKPELLDTVPHLQHMEGSAHFVEVQFRQDLKDGEEPLNPRGIVEDTDGTRHCMYKVILTDERLFSLLGIELLPPDSKEVHQNVVSPVYDYRTIEKGKQAEVIGYIKAESLGSLVWDHWSRNFVYLCKTSYFLDKKSLDSRAWEDFEGIYQGLALKHNIIFKAKPNEYKAAKKELTGLYHKQGKYTLTKAPIDNLYEVCYKDLRMNELLIQILWVMAGVALLCIVLTLFSSVSLDTRGRQKEVAIRKACGAGRRQIMWLFGKQYFWQLIASSIISLILSIATRFALYWADLNRLDNNIWEMHIPLLLAVLVVALITLLTVGYKIYRVSKLNPATIIKKE